MSATIWNWIIVYEDGTTIDYRGEYPPQVYEIDMGGVIAIIRNGQD